MIGRTGESAVLGCDLLKPDEVSPPLYVIEWVRYGFLLPIFIKFGLYSPRVDPQYAGELPFLSISGSLDLSNAFQTLRAS